MDLTTLLTGPLGGILGLGGALLQKWLGMKEAREAHAMKLAELEIISKIDLQKADILFRTAVEEKSGEAFRAAIDAQAGLRPTSGWARDFIALFRPGLTLALLVTSTGLAIWFHDSRPELLEFIIVSMFTMSSVATGYWFGHRTEEKFKVAAAFPTSRAKSP